MGTTLDALRAGSIRYVYTVAIEGYRYILTNGDRTAAAAAWATHLDFTAAIGGLVVELDNEQRIHPWEPFTGGGKCVLRVIKTPVDGDVFGVNTHRKHGGAETYLTGSLDRDATTIYVKSTQGFPESGTAYIGTECFSYTGIIETDGQGAFVGVTRGKFAPFAQQDYSFPLLSRDPRFAEQHRVGLDAQSVNLQPVVSELPRVWVGKWVGVWMHRVVDGVFDTKSEAQLVYAGRIADLRDDARTRATVIELKHVLDVLKDSTVGRSLWSATIKEGVYLSAGMRFDMSDTNRLGTTAMTPATTLEVVASPASGAYQMAEGYWSLGALFERLGQWWAQAKADADLYGAYTIDITNSLVELHWIIAGTAGHTGAWEFKMPKVVSILFGFETTNNYQFATGQASQHRAESTNDPHSHTAQNPPLRSLVFRPQGTQTGTVLDLNRTQVENERGVFVDQFGRFPSGMIVANDYGLEWGIFLLDNKFLVYGAKDGDEIKALFPSMFAYAGTNKFVGTFEGYSVPYDDDTGPIAIRQVLILQSSVAAFLKELLYTTGTEAYNSFSWDGGLGFGLGLPYELLADPFEDSVDALPQAQAPIVVVLDEPTSIADLIGGDLVLRRAFPRWRNGHVEFAAWRSPAISIARVTLDEGNKAEPAGNDADHRTAMAQSDEWVRSIVSVDFNRDITAIDKGGGYRDHFTFEDQVAVDDAGGEGKKFTIKARNTYGQYFGTGASIEALAPGFLETFPLFSRPGRRITRSIGSTLFEGLAVGDIVLVTDEEARDPATGERGMSARPGIVVFHRWDPGFLEPGQDEPSPPGGEVEVFFADDDPDRAGMVYVPSADVDFDATSAGTFDHGYYAAQKKLRCLTRRYSYPDPYFLNGYLGPITDLYDPMNFPLGTEVEIVERDPADPDAPLRWVRTVTAQAGSDITLDTALSSPAFDNTKRYRVTFAVYSTSSSVPTQLEFAYQADDLDGKIEDLAQPYLYGAGGAETPYQANTLTEIELPPNSTATDGAPRDVGTEAALARLLDNLIDYKTATQAPMLGAVMTNTDVVTGWKLVECMPVFLTLEQLSTAVYRYLAVAPFFRSADGTLTMVRVSLCRNRPTGSSVENVDRGVIYDETSFETASTTWQTPGSGALRVAVKSQLFGIAYVVVELAYKAEYRGLGELTEGPRLTP